MADPGDFADATFEAMSAALAAALADGDLAMIRFLGTSAVFTGCGFEVGKEAGKELRRVIDLSLSPGPFALIGIVNLFRKV